MGTLASIAVLNACEVPFLEFLSWDREPGGPRPASGFPCHGLRLSDADA